MMKVLFQYQGLITDQYKQFFQKNVPEGVEIVFSDSSNPDELIDEIVDTDLFVGYRLSENMMKSADKLRHIQIPWTGFNNFGQEHLIHKKNVTVSNSHSNSLAIAEHAVALLVATAKLVTFRHNKMMVGDWSPRRLDINSFWITGKTVGILGYGAIGRKIAKTMKLGFDCRILAMKRNESGYEKGDDIPDFNGGPDDLEYIIKESDYLVVAVPLTNETEGMLGEDQFKLMKPDTIIVNIARGPVIDEKSLFENLKDNRIGGAGIDTWYNYPVGTDDTENYQNYPFETLDNIIMSPHAAFKVRDRIEVFSQHILENIIRVYNNQEPINQVNLDLGY